MARANYPVGHPVDYPIDYPVKRKGPAFTGPFKWAIQGSNL